jgi:hypothetical protein
MTDLTRPDPPAEDEPRVHANTGPTPREVSYGTLLRNKEFAALVAAQVLSGVGDQIARVAIALAVFERSNSALYASAAFAVSYAPSIFGGTLLGPLADRISRRRLLLLCDLARAATIIVLAVLNPEQSPLWVALFLLFMTESFTPVYDAAWASLVPEILPEPRAYMRGSALLRVLNLVQQVVGLVIGGAAVALVSIQYALLLDAATFLISYVLLVVWVKDRPAGMPGLGGVRSLMRDVRDGAVDLFGDSSRRVLVIVAWMSAIYMITPMSVGLPYAVSVGADSAAGSLLMAATLAGTAVGSGLVAKAGPQRQLDVVLPMALGSSLVLVVAAFAPPLPVAVLVWFVSGTLLGFMVSLIGNVALFTRNQVRGRVMAMAAAGYNVLVAAVYLLGGWIADISSPATAVAGAGVVGVVLTLFAWLIWPSAALAARVDAAYAPERSGSDGDGTAPPA